MLRIVTFLVWATCSCLHTIAGADPSFASLEPPGIDLRAPRIDGFHDPNAIVYDAARYRQFVRRQSAIRNGPIVCGSANFTMLMTDGEYAGNTGLHDTHLGTRFRADQLIRFLDDRARREAGRPAGGDVPGPQADAAWERNRPRLLRPWDADVAAAVHMLGRVRATEAVPAITKLLRDPSPQVRAKAVYAVAEFGPAAGGAAPYLTPFLGHKELRSGAAHALGRVGAAAVPALVVALEDPDPLTRTYAGDALSQMMAAASEAVPALAARLDDAESAPASYAAKALGSIGSAAEPAIPALTRAARAPRVHPGHDVRNAAVAALSSLGRSATTALIALLTDPDGVVRCAIAGGWRADPSDEAAMAALSRALDDSDSYVRDAAKRTLKHLEDLATLIDATKAGTDAERCRAVEDLTRWQQWPAAVDTLIRLMHEPAAGPVAATAATSLGKMAPYSARATSALAAAAVRSPNEAVRSAADQALRLLAPPERRRVERRAVDE